METITAIIFNYLDNIISQSETIRKLKEQKCRREYLESYSDELHIDEFARIKKYILPNI